MQIYSGRGVSILKYHLRVRVGAMARVRVGVGVTSKLAGNTALIHVISKGGKEVVIVSYGAPRIV